MKWITEYFIKKALKKVSQTNKAQLSLEHIHHIGVIAPSLVELNETIEAITPIVGQKAITGLFYGEGSEAKEAFSYKDFSFTGKPKNSVAEFIQHRSDLIIVSAEKLNIFSLYLLYLNPQSYTVGFYDQSHAPYLDLMVSKEMDQKQNIENLLKYLKQVI
ncbi:MAG TPA: hypothetical protein VK014_13570 [Cyclobacteriaceae bacterium]|nr:hypothetical protein [Cyclobacteriaceae bacterium]